MNLFQSNEPIRVSDPVVVAANNYCERCRNSGFVHREVDGIMMVETFKSVDPQGKESVKLVKCDHNKDYGY